MPLISGYFKPLMPVENMFAFTAVSTDGIERDLILTQSCQVETHPISAIKDIDPQRLMNVLCKSVIYLLGGNSEIGCTANLSFYNILFKIWNYRASNTPYRR